MLVLESSSSEAAIEGCGRFFEFRDRPVAFALAKASLKCSSSVFIVVISFPISFFTTDRAESEDSEFAFSKVVLGVVGAEHVALVDEGD